jgi:hypothetical protein
MALSPVGWTRIRALAFGGAVPALLLGGILTLGHTLTHESDDDHLSPGPVPSGPATTTVPGAGAGFTLPDIAEFHGQAMPSHVRVCQPYSTQLGRAPVSSWPVTSQCAGVRD